MTYTPYSTLTETKILYTDQTDGQTGWFQYTPENILFMGV